MRLIPQWICAGQKIYLPHAVPSPVAPFSSLHLPPFVPEIDHASVNRYWENVKSSTLGPYMMDGFGFSVSAGDFRFRGEVRIVRRLLCGIEHNGPALDLGSGVGYWAEEFARSFSRVDGIEDSSTLCQALKE